jgi:hypothetical protein
LRELKLQRDFGSKNGGVKKYGLRVRIKFFSFFGAYISVLSVAEQFHIFKKENWLWN